MNRLLTLCIFLLGVVCNAQPMISFRHPGGKYGFIDASGRKIVDYKYDAAVSSAIKYGVVGLNGLYGVVDYDGQTVIPCNYGHIEIISENMFIATINRGGKQSHFLIDTKGAIRSREYDEIRIDKHYPLHVKLNEKEGLIDRNGKQLVGPVFSEIDSFSEGYAVVRTGDYVGGRFGLIDSTGHICVPLEYERLGPVKEGLCSATKNGKYGYIDTSGQNIIPFIYDWGSNFCEGVANVSKEYLVGPSGYIDVNGKVVIPFVFSSGEAFEDGKALARRDGKSVVIDHRGHILFSTKYVICYSLKSGYYVVREGYKYGICDSRGNSIIEPFYDDIVYMSDSEHEYLYVVYGDYRGMINNNGEIIVPCKHKLLYMCYNGAAFVGGASNKNYYAIDSKGKDYLFYGLTSFDAVYSKLYDYFYLSKYHKDSISTSLLRSWTDLNPCASESEIRDKEDEFNMIVQSALSRASSEF